MDKKSHVSSEKGTSKTQIEKDERLSKRLCYVLRYGAVKEGLTLHEGGMITSSQSTGARHDLFVF